MTPEYIQEFIFSLEALPDAKTDLALKRIIEIVKAAANADELKKQKALINRIAVDGVEKWDAIHAINDFTSKL